MSKEGMSQESSRSVSIPSSERTEVANECPRTSRLFRMITEGVFRSYAKKVNKKNRREIFVLPEFASIPERELQSIKKHAIENSNTDVLDCIEMVGRAEASLQKGDLPAVMDFLTQYPLNSNRAKEYEESWSEPEYASLPSEALLAIRELLKLGRVR